jgi:hypothetical protein
MQSEAINQVQCFFVAIAGREFGADPIRFLAADKVAHAGTAANGCWGVIEHHFPERNLD